MLGVIALAIFLSPASKLRVSASTEVQRSVNNSDLLNAAYDGHASMVKQLLGHRANIETDKHGNTPLMAAAWKGHLSVAKQLLDSRAVVETRNPDGNTALSLAAYRGHASVAVQLLDDHANVEAKNSDGSTPLMIAASQGHASVVSQLLAGLASIEVSDEQGYTALMVAAAHGHTSVVKQLLEHQASVEAEDLAGNAVLIIATLHGHVSVAKYLLDHKARVGAKNINGNTALIMAADEGHAPLVTQLLTSGADVEATNSAGQTALMAAANQGHVSVAKQLLEQRANIEAETVDSSTALVYAALNGHIVMTEQLLVSRAGTEATNKFGDTPLMLAAIQSYVSLTTLLLAHGASVEARNSFGQTAAMLAASKRGPSDPVVKLLLAQGADPADVLNVMLCSAANVTDAAAVLQQGADVNAWVCEPPGSPLLAAARHGKRSVAQFLQKHGASASYALLRLARAGGGANDTRLLLQLEADLGSEDALGRTALHWSAWYGHYATVKLLVASGADRLAKDSAGQTPRTLAASGGHLGLETLLPKETLSEAVSRMRTRPEVVIMGVACLCAVLLAVLTTRVRRSAPEIIVPGPSRGAALLAAKASFSKNAARGSLVYRVADMVAAAVLPIAAILMIDPFIWMPVLAFLYVAPALHSHWDGECLDLAAQFSAVPASLLVTQKWQRRDTKRTAIGLGRLLIMTLLLVYGVARSREQANEAAWLWNLINGLRIVRGVHLPVLFVDTLLSWGTPVGQCHLDQDGCLVTDCDFGHACNCFSSTPRRWASFVLNVSELSLPNTTASNFLINGELFGEECPSGIPTWGVFSFTSEPYDGEPPFFRLCRVPRVVFIDTPSVSDMLRCAAACAACACIFAWAGALRTALQVPWLQHLRKVDVSEDPEGNSLLVQADSDQHQQLAEEIDTIINAAGATAEQQAIRDSLAALTGCISKVEPVTPFSVRLDVAMVVADVGLDLNTIRTFTINENLIGASILAFVFLYSTLRQILSGRLRRLLREMLESVRTGKLSDGLLEVFDEERGNEAFVSLLITFYGLPFAVQTPKQTILVMASILSGCYGAGKFLSQKLDLEGAMKR